MTETTPEITRPETVEVRTGRELSLRLLEALGELLDRRQLPECVWLRDEAAECMKAYFAHCGRPAVLPADLAGIPLRVGNTGGKAFAIVLPDRRAVEH